MTTRWATGNYKFVYSSLWDFKSSFTCRKILRHGTSPLYFPSERKVCCGFLSPLKIHRLGRVLNPQLLGPVASTLTTTPPRRPPILRTRIYFVGADCLIVLLAYRLSHYQIHFPIYFIGIVNYTCSGRCNEVVCLSFLYTVCSKNSTMKLVAKQVLCRGSGG
jgi:hypothetical protein